MKVGAAQIRPVWLDKAATARKVIETIAEASEQGIELLAFPETFLSGYPFWVCRTNGAAWADPRQERAYSQYLDAAVEIDAPEMRAITEAARDYHVSVCLGISERGRRSGRGTVYSALVTIHKERGVVGCHRKLMPTHDERLCWGIGDARDLRVHPIGPWMVGGLNCWENWMPLARVALYGAGEDLHISVWPGNASVTADVPRVIAMEGRVWSVSCCGLLSLGDVPEDFEFRQDLTDAGLDTIFTGGSVIVAPGGTTVAQAPDGFEGILSHEVNLDAVRQARHNFDPTGHYSRPDIFRLQLTRFREEGTDD